MQDSPVSFIYSHTEKLLRTVPTWALSFCESIFRPRAISHLRVGIMSPKSKMTDSSNCSEQEVQVARWHGSRDSNRSLPRLCLGFPHRHSCVVTAEQGCFSNVLPIQCCVNICPTCWKALLVLFSWRKYYSSHVQSWDMAAVLICSRLLMSYTTWSPSLARSILGPLYDSVILVLFP